MYKINDDLSIYATRGDVVLISVSAMDGDEAYKFQPGEVLRIKVFAKKNCNDVVMEKSFPIYEESETVELLLTEEDTKFGDVISKPTDYWYEVELNPFTLPQTIIGYDEDGAKIFKLFPEGADIDEEITEEDIPFVDSELDITSTHPVENQAIAREMLSLKGQITSFTDIADDIQSLAYSANANVASVMQRLDGLMSDYDLDETSELYDARFDNSGREYPTVGEHIRGLGDKFSEYITKLAIEGYSTADVLEERKYYAEKNTGKYFSTAASGLNTNADWNCYVLSVKEEEMYQIKAYTKADACAIAFMDKDWGSMGKAPIEVFPSYESDGEVYDSIAIVPPLAKYMIVNEKPSEGAVEIKKVVGVKYVPMYNSNVLKGKKLAYCGDTIIDARKPDSGYFHSYASQVGSRNEMEYTRAGAGSFTMAVGNGNGFSVSRYKNLPEFDYLTLSFGYDDVTLGKLGTIADTDNNTFYGAYKMVLEYLVVNHPTKKIGVVVPYGDDSINPYAEAVRRVADMYGVPYLDLKGNSLWGTASATQTARKNALTYDGVHLNQAGHDYIATMYENFLRSL